ncbi:type III-A CRISPR-associated RAMP protein Csm4 [Phascolarctobacterium succinatutens]|uniref:type III-A CRISPR-associated RAMP protein Csm4 n=1 Tax=Phascolarctobacterium succinatutens TaxID=626940 RepID=UPI0026F376B2|nr:type III-A CRISPR-associated RAMP protein Csm4 [Phascolarctobacterium succinatutens]
MMMYYIFTLKFLTPVHFGDTANGGGLDKFSIQCSADTLFAALCNEAANKGSDAVEKLVKKTAEGKIVFSSLFPYWRTADDDLYFYLPKPLLKLEQEEQQSAKSFEEIKQLATKLKKQKKSTYIRASQINSLLKYGGSNGQFAVPEFAAPLVAGRVALREEKPLPYYVGSYVFSKHSGLYFILGVEHEEEFALIKDLLLSLGYSGIGGKRSSGYGKFELADDELELFDDGGVYDDDTAIALMLYNEKSKYQMCLAPVCPCVDEIAVVKQGSYKLIKRSGFIASSAAKDNIKRNSIYMLQEGSCFSERLRGQMLQQTVDGLAHDIYRDGIGMFVGLKNE